MNADVWLGLARVRALAGQPAEEAAALDEVLDFDPARIDARSRRAELRLELGQDEGALLDAAAATEANPGDVRAWRALARATARVKGAAAGLEVLERAVRRRETTPSCSRSTLRSRPGAAGAPRAPSACANRRATTPGAGRERWGR